MTVDEVCTSENCHSEPSGAAFAQRELALSEVEGTSEESAFCVVVGTTGGQVYASADAGDSWNPIVRDLPAVLSVEVQTLG